MTTTNEETNGTPKKRKPAGTGKRIKEMETDYAVAITEGRTEDATALRAAINRIENGEPEEAPAAEPTVTWNDVVQASIDNQANRVEREIVEDVIEVELSDTDKARIAEENAADHQDKTERQRRLDAAKATAKEEKTAIDALDTQMAGRHRDVTRGKTARKAHWIREAIFATNTVRWLDPTTEACVKTVSMDAAERQIDLPLVNEDKTKQLNLGEVDPTESTDPEALLAAAEKGDEVSPSDTNLDNDGDPDEDESDDEDGEV